MTFVDASTRSASYVWTCAKGQTEHVTNNGNVVGITGRHIVRKHMPAPQVGHFGDAAGRVVARLC